MIELLIILILIYLYFILNHRDGFTLLEDTSFVKFDDDILDSFYCKIYDDLYDTIKIHKKESECIMPYIKESSDVLCIDCRTGHLVQLLSNVTNITGMETSSSMVECSKQTYPELSFQYGKYNPYLFKHKTHIICPLFSIHTKRELGHFFSVCYNWLIHRGYLFISYMKSMKNISNILQNPSLKFQYNYTFSIDIEDKSGYSIVTENIMNKNGTTKRKNIWNYKSIQLDNLIYEAGLRGFKFIKECDNGPFDMVIFTKSS